jgi:hypothetical protein
MIRRASARRHATLGQRPPLPAALWRRLRVPAWVERLRALADGPDDPHRAGFQELEPPAGPAEDDRPRILSN